MYRPIAQLSLPTLSADTLQSYKRARWLMSVKIGQEVEGLLRYLHELSRILGTEVRVEEKGGESS